MSVAHDEVVEAMRRRRHVPYNKPRTISRPPIPNFFADLWNQLTGALVLLTGVISSIGLLVGGIGVMNIMLISVTERTEGDRHSQSDRRAKGGHPRAVSAGGGDAFRAGRRDRNPAGRADRVHHPHAAALDSGDALAALGDRWASRFR